MRNCWIAVTQWLRTCWLIIYLHGIAWHNRELRIIWRICLFSSLSRLMEVARRMNESVKKISRFSSMIRSTPKKRPTIAALQKDRGKASNSKQVSYGKNEARQSWWTKKAVVSLSSGWKIMSSTCLRLNSFFQSQIRKIRGTTHTIGRKAIRWNSVIQENLLTRSTKSEKFCFKKIVTINDLTFPSMVPEA